MALKEINYWLMKSEPDAYSIKDLEKEEETLWDGIRNYQARNFMRSMEIGDQAFFYHSNTKPPGIVGLMEIIEKNLIDPFQFDESSKYFDKKSKRHISNSIEILYNDQTQSEKITIENPIGHPSRREEAVPLLEEKFMKNVESTFSLKKAKNNLDILEESGSLEEALNGLNKLHRDAAEQSPYLEVFKAKKYEVLFLYDPIDEVVMDHLGQFEEKSLTSAEKADLKIEDEDKKTEQLSDEDAEALAKWAKDKLGDKVESVRISTRLVNSPAVVLDSDKSMTAGMRRMMKSMNQDLGPVKVDMELNPRHVIVSQLHAMKSSNEIPLRYSSRNANVIGLSILHRFRAEPVYKVSAST